MTSGSAWFSGEEKVKGKIVEGNYADLVVLSEDYFTINEERIKNLESLLTIVDGKIVYGKDKFENYSPALPEISPDWSPVKYYGGYYN